MKYLFFIALGATLFACNITDKKATQEDKGRELREADAKKDTANYTTIEWIDSPNLDLGTITKGETVELSWRFKNIGNKALTVLDVRAGCGCTTPDTPKEPIAPGAEGVIKAKFNSSNFSGRVTKDVFVDATNTNRNNGVDNKLSFTANIKEE